MWLKINVPEALAVSSTVSAIFATMLATVSSITLEIFAMSAITAMILAMLHC